MSAGISVLKIINRKSIYVRYDVIDSLVSSFYKTKENLLYLLTLSVGLGKEKRNTVNTPIKMIGARSYEYSGYPAKLYVCATFLELKDARNTIDKSVSKPNLNSLETLEALAIKIGHQRMQQNTAIVLSTKFCIRISPIMTNLLKTVKS